MRLLGVLIATRHIMGLLRSTSTTVLFILIPTIIQWSLRGPNGIDYNSEQKMRQVELSVVQLQLPWVPRAGGSREGDAWSQRSLVSRLAVTLLPVRRRMSKIAKTNHKQIHLRDIIFMRTKILFIFYFIKILIFVFQLSCLWRWIWRQLVAQLATTTRQRRRRRKLVAAARGKFKWMYFL